MARQRACSSGKIPSELKPAVVFRKKKLDKGLTVLEKYGSENNGQ